MEGGGGDGARVYEAEEGVGRSHCDRGCAGDECRTAGEEVGVEGEASEGEVEGEEEEAEEERGRDGCGDVRWSWELGSLLL